MLPWIPNYEEVHLVTVTRDGNTRIAGYKVALFFNKQNASRFENDGSLGSINSKQVNTYHIAYDSLS